MKKAMYGDNINLEWIYMLEDKLFVYDELNGKFISHEDFKQVVKDWKKLIK